ncbi:MAG: TlpA family protein disulfide reductase [Candidatus Omnitrophica bacterium]|jgi:thiol-disulfide isomerase/thioredoxin|nr:TlpA family protein disulfide reductase [Candidatus Omnitrophota bacterium]
MKKTIIIILILVYPIISVLAKEVGLYTLEGKSVTYEELTTYPKTVLFFWTTWCPSCVREITKFNKENINFGDTNIVYINGDQNKKAVEKFIKTKNINKDIQKKIILDNNLYIAKKFSIFAIPTFVFLKDGQPIYKSYFITPELVKDIFKD